MDLEADLEAEFVPPQQEAPPESSPGSARSIEPPVAPQPRDIVCPRCHRSNAADSAFCFTCGAPLHFPAADRSESSQLRAFEYGAPGSFLLRAVAYIIDTLAVVMPLVFLWLVLGQPVPENFDQILEPPQGYERLQLLVLFLTMAYDTALITYWATTVGKRAFGMYVVRTDGSRVGFVRALSRHVLTALSANLTLGFVFLFVAFRRDRRGLHDLICDTVVIRRFRQREDPHSDVR